VNYSRRLPTGNRHMRRIFNQFSDAAARTKGNIVAMVYRPQGSRRRHNQAIGMIAHRLWQLIWDSFTRQAML